MRGRLARSVGQILAAVALSGLALRGGVATAQHPLRGPQPAESIHPSSFILHPSAASPQPEESTAGAPFSGPTPLEALVRHALANNREIQAARYHASALGHRVPQAASLPDPQLVTTAFLESIQTAAGPQEVAMSLQQKFPWFGKRALRSQVASRDAMAAYSRLAATELAVVEQVKRAYFDLYYVESAIAETRTLQPRLEDVIEIARTKYETDLQGKGLETVLKAQIELARLKTTLVQLENNKRQAQARLAGVLHLPPETRIEAVERIDPTRVAQTAVLLVGLAESLQPELEAQRWEVDRDRTSIEVARREYWPDVTVGFNWYEIGPAGLSPVANGRDAYALGVGVNLPIYRNRLDAAVREAQCRTAASRRRYEAARDRVHTEVQTLYAQFTEHHQVLAILQKDILPQAERTLKLSTESYRLGRLDFQQLIDTYRTLLDYRIEVHKREAMREQAIASLERAVGGAITAEPAETPAQLGQ